LWSIKCTAFFVNLESFLQFKIPQYSSVASGHHWNYFLFNRVCSYFFQNGRRATAKSSAGYLWPAGHALKTPALEDQQSLLQILFRCYPWISFDTNYKQLHTLQVSMYIHTYLCTYMAGPWPVDAPGRLIILFTFKPTFLKPFQPMTGLANPFEGVCAQTMDNF